MSFIPFTLLGFGFLLGIKHAFDADHVAAVSTIISKHNSIKKSSLTGIFWGFGHTISLLFIGLIVLLFKIPMPEKLTLSFEFIVGLMLVVLGFNVLMTARKNKIHFHKHKHGGKEHIHFHSHLGKNHSHKHQPLLIGLIHGLAGSAALTLLALTAIDSIFVGIIYILIFGIGSVIGMILATNMISLPFRFVKSRFERTHKILRLGTSLTSVVMGLMIIYTTIGILL